MAERYNSGGCWYNAVRKSDRHPQYSGIINVEGVEYFIDTWVKESTKTEGEKFLSFSVKKKDKQEGVAQKPVVTDSPL